MQSFRENTCPVCGEEGEFEYGALEVNDTGIYYPFKCTACGAEGKEHYSLNFIQCEVED